MKKNDSYALFMPVLYGTMEYFFEDGNDLLFLLPQKCEIGILYQMICSVYVILSRYRVR